MEFSRVGAVGVGSIIIISVFLFWLDQGENVESRETIDSSSQKEPEERDLTSLSPSLDVELLAVSGLDDIAVLKLNGGDMQVVHTGDDFNSGEEYSVERILNNSVFLRNRLSQASVMITKEGDETTMLVLSSSTDISKDTPLVTN